MNRNIAVLVPLMLMLGCVSLFRGVITITKVVDGAMREAAALKQQGFLPADVELRLIEAHNKYRAAAGTAADALEAYKINQDKASYVRALEAARAAASGIIDIIVPLVGVEKVTWMREDLKKASEL